MCLLTLSGIKKQLPDAFVLNNISFTQEKLQKIAIAGETGSGKTTLLKTIAGLVQPDAGTVLFNGKRITGPDEQLVPGHAAIAYLSQHFELRNNYRVEELLEYANKLSVSNAQRLYAVCRIDHLLKRRTDQLSGGEKQRIALARLLVGSPSLLLLDEPFSNLDPIHKKILKSVIRDISEKLSITCLLTSHDPQDTLSWADEIIVLKDGHILQSGSPRKLYHQPVNAYVAGLFGPYDLISGILFEQLTGSPASLLNGKALFVRPEYFHLLPPQQNSLHGSITNILFQGSYYEVEIAVLDTTISLKTTDTHLIRGSTVYVSLFTEEAWYL